jgi:hypothetical protein
MRMRPDSMTEKQPGQSMRRAIILVSQKAHKSGGAREHFLPCEQIMGITETGLDVF